jgi:hypothetical protein
VKADVARLSSSYFEPKNRRTDETLYGRIRRVFGPGQLNVVGPLRRAIAQGMRERVFIPGGAITHKRLEIIYESHFLQRVAVFPAV